MLIDERNRPKVLDPISRFHSFFEWNLGGYSLLDKMKMKHPSTKIYYAGKDVEFQRLILQRHPEILPFKEMAYDETILPENHFPWELQRVVTSLIEDSLNFNKDWKKFRQKYKVKSSGFHVVGKDKHLYVHPNAVVYPGVVFDTSGGPILVDEGVKISSFSFLEGPLYIGKSSQIDNARITGGTLIGNNCRIGGEVENSIILDYSNKHHEGFLGHSFVSSWVNLGALSTTSDLKNNYGIVKLKTGDVETNTGTIKFGSMLGPFSKIAIGVMLNTGSVTDIGCNLLDSRVSGYQSPFTWIRSGGHYRLEDFINDTRKIMARRSINLLPFEEEYLRSLYVSLVDIKI
ncbi:glucose-1-phosphate thymidylyltransferase [Leptospira idonii]|uniref:Glucose-1-phosphate thymidylyltransferase n=1 Tax=Leptospira idonii TaxID=1193500 RepID=A0A4R9M0G3_9LEPT|nr:glucose-1-phosphate thymidylyltransferase [Leptospira idonii]